MTNNAKIRAAVAAFAAVAAISSSALAQSAETPHFGSRVSPFVSPDDSAFGHGPSAARPNPRPAYTSRESSGKTQNVLAQAGSQILR